MAVFADVDVFVVVGGDGGTGRRCRSWFGVRTDGRGGGGGGFDVAHEGVIVD